MKTLMLIFWVVTKSSVLKMEAVCSSETLLYTYQSTWCYNPNCHIDLQLRLYGRFVQVCFCCSMEVLNNNSQKEALNNLQREDVET
jgi:hypothetical protein